MCSTSCKICLGTVKFSDFIRRFIKCEDFASLVYISLDPTTSCNPLGSFLLPKITVKYKHIQSNANHQTYIFHQFQFIFLKNQRSIILVQYGPVHVKLNKDQSRAEHIQSKATAQKGRQSQIQLNNPHSIHLLPQRKLNYVRYVDFKNDFHHREQMKLFSPCNRMKFTDPEVL